MRQIILSELARIQPTSWKVVNFCGGLVRDPIQSPSMNEARGLCEMESLKENL